MDDYFMNADVYDSYKKYGVQIKKKPRYSIDIALDHKRNLIKKAKKLDFYNNFIQADANDMLPFESESIQTVFSNIIYWLNKPEIVFQEIHRVLMKGGTCCVMLPSPTYLESSFYYSLYLKGKFKEFQFLEMIDRGRIKENLKVVKSYAEWKQLIEKSGLKIEECKPHLSKTVIQIWDIGLRPIFPMLYKMTRKLDYETFMNVKKEWVDLFQKICEPIVLNDDKLGQEKGFCFFCFYLTK